MNEYEKQANDFLDKYGIEFHYTNLGPSHHWGMLRYKYSIRFVRRDKKGDEKEFTLFFYGSNADYTSDKKGITAYDVLSCISGNDQYKTYKDIRDSFGDDLTGINVDGLIQESKDMRRFFTSAMLRDLSEIQ